MNISNKIKNLKVRVKLLLAFGSILFITLILLAVIIYSANQFRKVEKSSERIERINAASLAIESNINYFIFENYKSIQFQKQKETPILKSFFEGVGIIHKQIDTLKSGEFDQLEVVLDSINYSISELESDFINMVDRFKLKGFKDFGLEGELRAAIHNVEQSEYPYSKVDMLMLRRHEKDFFLRKDLKYLNEFLTKLESMYQSVSSNHLEAGKSEILKNLDEYRQKFSDVVEVEKQIGLTENDGKRSVIRKEMERLNRSISNAKTEMKALGNQTEKLAMIILVIVVTAQLTLGVFMAVIYSAIITRAVKQLLTAMTTVAQGSFPDHLPVQSHDELGRTKMMFNQLLDRMKSASDFSYELGKGNLQANYNQNETQDVLAVSLIKMQHALIEAKDKQDKINWANYGSAQLNEILKHENEEIYIIAEKILKMLVKYLQVNQGAIYLVEEENGHAFLDRISTYAYDKKKFISNRIEFGQGLAGQCALEMEPIIMTSVPDDYIKITSGLGEVLPSFVIIIPLVIQSKAFGVMEFASFEVLENYKIEFLKKISENIASILNNKKINEQTKKLLAEANAKEQQLKSQEEELRQNSEEMQAVQEQMERQQQDLIKEIEELKFVKGSSQISMN